MKRSLKNRRKKRLYRVYKHIKSKIILITNIKIYLYLLHYFLIAD